MLELKYTDGLIPVIVFDAASCSVLMMAWANEDAVRLSRETGFAHYWSRSRKKLWKKGEESGHFQKVLRILADCDGDCLVYEVEQTGAACHTGHRSCFYRTLEGEEIAPMVFDPEKVYRHPGH